MRIFHCDHCEHLVFFENTQCVRCGHTLAFLPDAEQVGSLDPLEGELWCSPLSDGRSYRKCTNYAEHNVCNWAVLASDPHAMCVSCRLTRTIPDLSQAGHRDAWYRAEQAKRRLVYTLLGLDLPLTNKEDDPESGLAFDFLADGPEARQPPVLTGHAGGVITINIAEADDAERERRRATLHEPYRTLLGHLRHESGHYYWDRLVQDREWIAGFRERFGDEQQDYAQAIEQYYHAGPTAEWQEQFVSSYACSHPWEDWAETWAHYLHITDALETAAECGVSIRPRRADEPLLQRVPAQTGKHRGSFEQLMDCWFPLTYVLNNLNRGLGLPDAYPFILSTPVIEKLRFIHEVVAAMPSTAGT